MRVARNILAAPLVVILAVLVLFGATGEARSSAQAPVFSLADRGAQRTPPARPAPHPNAPRPSVLSVHGSVAWITPPWHPGAQPVIAVLDDRCSASECEPDSDVARPFGWSVCVRDLHACAGGELSDAGTVMDTVLRTIAASNPGSLAPSGGTLILRGRRSADLASVVRATPGRWNTLLLVEPTAFADAHSLAQFSRVGLVETRCPAVGAASYDWAQRAFARGVHAGWFLGGARAATRRSMLHAAVQWLFVGGDPAAFAGRSPCVPSADGEVARAPH